MQICVLSSSCLTISASSVSHNSLKTTIPLHFPFTSVMFSHFYIPGHLSCILTSFCFPKTLPAVQSSQMSKLLSVFFLLSSQRGKSVQWCVQQGLCWVDSQGVPGSLAAAKASEEWLHFFPPFTNGSINNICSASCCGFSSTFQELNVLGYSIWSKTKKCHQFQEEDLEYLT